MTVCKGCQIGEMGNDGKKHVPQGRIIAMKGGWVLNHSGEQKGNYLGHLILQPREHRVDINTLSDDEAEALGTNIRSVVRALKGYWKQEFAWDCLERVYAVYFWESEFSKTFAGEWHMHIHLFPRTKVMVEGEDPTEVAAWKLPELIEKAHFPSEYKIKDDNMKKLMDYLEQTLLE
jgi:diadenosine tetraphosphate (Ap4A) HIT family hydrolase